MVDMAKAVYPDNLIKWIRWYTSSEDGLLYVRNTSNEPIRIRATGTIISSNYKLKHNPITYVIQWQGLPDEERILWPNDIATLYVVNFGLRPKGRFLPPDKVLLFPTAEREKTTGEKGYRVNFIIENPEIINYSLLLSNKPKKREIKLRVALNANSLLNPTKHKTISLVFKIQTSGNPNTNAFQLLSRENE